MARTKSNEPKPVFRLIDKSGKQWIVCSKTQMGRILTMMGQNVVLDAQRIEDNGGFQIANVEEFDATKLSAQQANMAGLKLLGVEF